MNRMKKIANSIGKIAKSLGQKAYLELKQAFVQKWNEKEPKEHYFQLGKLSIIALIMILVYTSFFTMEKTAEESPVLIEEPKVPDMLRIVETGDFSNLDSVLVNDQSALNVLNNIMEGLMRLDQNNKPTYGMAEKVEISPDYKTYTFTIRKNAKWSDGKPVTANDFYFAWMRAIDPKTGSKNAHLFNEIKGVKEYRSREDIEPDIKVIDNKLIVGLVKSNINFLSLVCNPALFPQRKDVVLNSNYGTSIKNFIINGPYKLKVFDPFKIIVSKNDLYWNSKEVYINKISFLDVNNNDEINNLYMSDEADLAPGDKEFYTNITLSAGTRFIVLNNKISTKDKKLLASTIKAIDFSEGLESTKLIPSSLNTSSLHNERIEFIRINENDKLEAKNLDIITNEHSSYMKSVELLQREIKEKLKIELGLIQLKSFKKQRELEKKGEFDLSLTSWLADYHDPLTFLDIFTTNAVENTSGYSNPKFDQLVAQAHEEIDPKKQAKLIAEAENILVNEDIAVIPLYQKVIPRLQKPYVQGVVYHPYGAEYSLKWAQIKEIK